jgi:hypothetical protein
MKTVSVKSRRDSQREAGHTSTSSDSRGSHVRANGLDGLGLKTITVAGFPVWATKPGVGPGEDGQPRGRVASSRRSRGDEARLLIGRDHPMGKEEKGTEMPLRGRFPPN